VRRLVVLLAACAVGPSAKDDPVASGGGKADGAGADVFDATACVVDFDVPLDGAVVSIYAHCDNTDVKIDSTNRFDITSSVSTWTAKFAEHGFRGSCHGYDSLGGVRCELARPPDAVPTASPPYTGRTCVVDVDIQWDDSNAIMLASCDGTVASEATMHTGSVEDIGPELVAMIAKLTHAGFSFGGCHTYTSLLGTRCYFANAALPLASPPPRTGTACVLHAAATDHPLDDVAPRQLDARRDRRVAGVRRRRCERVLQLAHLTRTPRCSGRRPRRRRRAGRRRSPTPRPPSPP
jgi:hypothetical protein